MPAFAPRLELHAEDRRWYVVRSKARKEDYAVQLLEQYYRVVWTPGVRSFVAFGATPTPLRDSVISFIAASAGEGGIIRQLAPFRTGDRVQIKSGPLAGLVAIVQRPCSGCGRVQILLDFLRQGATVELPVGLLDRI